MNKIIKRITDNRLKDFSGLSIEGEIPVSEEMINDVLQLFIGNEKNNLPEKPSETSSENTDKIDFSEIIKMLDVKDVKISLKEKKAVLKVEMRKY